jgi:hypothetical protein
MTYHNQTKELTNWFLNLPLNESIDNKKHKVWSSNPKPHEAQLDDQKVKKSSIRSSRKRKNRKAKKSMKSGKLSKRVKKSSNSRKAQNQHSQCKLSPLDWHYHVSSLNHPVSKEFNQLCAHTLPLSQWTHQTQSERRMRCYASDQN